MKFNGLFVIALAIALQGLTAPANAKDAPLVLAATSPWVADFADNECTASGEFSDGEDTVVLQFISYAPGPSVTVIIASDTLSLRVKGPTLQVLPAGEARSPEYFTELEARGGWSGAEFPLTFEESGLGDGGILVEGVFRDVVELQSVDLANAMEGMRKCKDDLAKKLGLDPETQRSLLKPAAINIDNWNPGTSSEQQEFARVGSFSQKVRLIVEPDGKVSGCNVVWGSNDESIAEAMCAALRKNARLEPALNADSQPVKSSAIVTLAARRQTGLKVR